MAPASAKVQSSNNVVRLPEEFVSGPLDDSLNGKDVEERNEEHCDHSKNNVLLCHELGVSAWLRLVKFAFDNGPAQGVQKRLDKNDATCPSMEKHKMLVRNSSEQGKNAFARRQSDGQGCESVGKGTDPVSKTTESGTSTVQSRTAFDGSDPCLVDNANKAVWD